MCISVLIVHSNFRAGLSLDQHFQSIGETGKTLAKHWPTLPKARPTVRRDVCSTVGATYAKPLAKRMPNRIGQRLGQLPNVH